MKRLLMMAVTLAALCAAEPADPGHFSRNVYPVLQSANCRGCHSADGVASATRLRFPEEPADSKAIEAFGVRLQQLVNREKPSQSLLVQKPTNGVPHGGGERIKPGSPEASVLLEWAKHLASIPTSAQPLETAAKSVARMTIRRLTHSQYNNTIRDLLGDQTQPARGFPAEDYVDGFKNQIGAQVVSPLLTEAYFAASEKLARNAFRFGDRGKLLPCNPQSPEDRACASLFVRTFGSRAFRRPIDAVEEKEFTTLLISEARRARSFQAGAQMVVRAMLQSPHFLFRIETGGSPARAPYGIASLLSYSLWDTMPDDELMQAAASGLLGTKDGVSSQIRRLLRSPRASDSLNEFIEQWMRFDRLLSSVKDRRLYPEFVPSLASAMTEETRRFMHHVIRNNRNFMEIFSADYTFVNEELATLYGLPAPPEPFLLVQYPAGSERSGVLGHGLYLAQTGKPEETSPTERGLFVREHFLCQGVPPPPPGVNTTPPPFLIGAKAMTNRERLEKLHLSDASCAGCHNLMDPIGFGLERFDTIGRWQEKQKLTIFPTKDQRSNVKPQKFELPIDTKATLLGIPNSNFASARELGRILANDPTCQKCIVRQWFRYTMGRHESEADHALLDRAYQDFRRSNFQFQEMIASILGGLVEGRQR